PATVGVGPPVRALGLGHVHEQAVVGGAVELARARFGAAVAVHGRVRVDPVVVGTPVHGVAGPVGARVPVRPRGRPGVGCCGAPVEGGAVLVHDVGHHDVGDPHRVDGLSCGVVGAEPGGVHLPQANTR